MTTGISRKPRWALCQGVTACADPEIPEATQRKMKQHRLRKEDINALEPFMGRGEQTVL